MDSSPEDRDAPTADEGRQRKRPKLRRRVAEIVLVLSAMSRLRGGGRAPTDAEVRLMAEARGKLVELCGGLAPRDVAERDSVAAVIEDLGLNSRAKDQKLGFRGPRLTIAEKFAQSKKKMEDSRKYPAQPSSFPSQSALAGFNPPAEVRGTSHTMRTTPLDKHGYQLIPSVGASSSQVGHVSTAMSSSVPYQMPTTNDIKPPVVCIGNLGRDVSSTAVSRVDRPQVKLEGGPNVPTYASQGQGNPPTWSVQPQVAKNGAEQTKKPIYMPQKVDVSSQMNIPRVIPQPMPFVPQPAPGTMPSTLHQLQPVKFSQGSSLYSGHNEIAKIVQKLLQPKLPDHPTWIPPSRDYMTKALACQVCHISINDVENVLVCDACEKGYHTKCTQPTNQRGIPRGEWHCARCLSLSNGKPLPPKYGRVMRSNTPLKASSSSDGVQALSQKKVRTIEPTVGQPNLAADGVSALQSLAQPGGVAFGSNDISSASDSITLNYTKKGNSSPDGMNVDEKPILGSSPSAFLKSSETAYEDSSPGSYESSGQPENDSKLSTQNEESDELNSLLDQLSDENVDKAESSQPSQDLDVVDQSDQPNSSADASEKLQELNPLASDSDNLKLDENLECNLRVDSKHDNQDSALEKTVASSAAESEIMQHSGGSSDESLSVEWTGDVIHVVDEKTFYQSFQADGVMYKLQDHVLFQSDHGKLTPSKIQSMWEDGNTGSKWVTVNRHIFPSDLPESHGRPCSADSNEVYESNQCETVIAGHIKGQCEVLPQTKFEDESRRRNQLAPPESDNVLPPVYLCKWLYDEVKGSFQPISG